MGKSLQQLEIYSWESLFLNWSDSFFLRWVSSPNISLSHDPLKLDKDSCVFSINFVRYFWASPFK